MHAFLFLHVETELVNALITEEGVHPLRLFQSIRGEHGDGMEVDVSLTQGADTAHGLGKGALAVSEASVAVVDLLRSIDTHSDNDSVANKAVAPVLIDERCVGLNMLFDDHPLSLKVGGLALDDGTGLVVEACWQGQRLAGVPQDREMGTPERTFINPLQQQGQLLLEVEHIAPLAIRQVAVAAVEVAERGRLNHQQTDGAVCGMVHQLAKPPR